MSIKRRWLNPVSSSDNGWMKYGIQKAPDYAGYWYSLKVADCNRVVDFSFDFDNKKGRQTGLRKLLLMEDAITDMREQCEAIIEHEDD